MLVVTWPDVIAQLTRLHAEREQRAMNKCSESSGDYLRQVQTQQRNKQTPRPTTSQATSLSSTTATTQIPPFAEAQTEEETTISLDAATRDPNVSNVVWQQLQSDRALREREEAAVADAIRNAQAEEAAAQAKALEKQAAIADEARRLHEAMRLKAAAAKQKAEEEAMRLKKLMEERQHAQQQERKAQEKLRQMGVCPVGYRWIKQSGGYRCAGGSHFVGNEELF